MAQKDELGLPPHPGLAFVARYRVFGIAAALLACGAFALGAPLPGVGLALFSVVTLWVALYSGPQFKAVQINNFAYDHMTRGDLDSAERILARAGESSRTGLIARAIASQRATIALQRRLLKAVSRQRSFQYRFPKRRGRRSSSIAMNRCDPMQPWKRSAR